MVLDGADQGGAVRRLAHRAGGDGAHLLGAGPLRELGEPLQRQRGAGDGRGGEPAGAEDLLPQPDRGAVLGEDDGAAVGVHLRDLQARRIRAQVDDGEDRAAPLH